METFPAPGLFCAHVCLPAHGGECRRHHLPPSGIRFLQVGCDFVLRDFVPDPCSLAKPRFFKNLKPSSPPLPAECFPKSHTHIYTWKLQSDCEQAPSKEMLHLINETLIAKTWSGSWFLCPPLPACNWAGRCAPLNLLAGIPCITSSPPSVVGGRRGRQD